MKISGSNVVEQPVGKVWEALLDPRVLVATIPGCERLEPTGQDAYAMTVTAGVAAIKGTYAGTCALSDLAQHESLTMKLSGSGAPGTVDATVQVRFSEPAPGRTEIAYDADATVGGMVGGVGQRMLTSVSKRMAAEFFGNVAAAIAAPAPLVEQVSTGSTHDVVETPAGEPLAGAAPAPAYVRPPTPSREPNSDEFLKGIAVGAGLVLLGVVAGSVLGRRR